MNASQRNLFYCVIITILLGAFVLGLMGVTPEQIRSELGFGTLSVKISSATLNVPVYYSDGSQTQPAFYLNDNAGPFEAKGITQDGRYTLIEISEVQTRNETRLYYQEFWVETQNLSVWNDGDWRYMPGEVNRDLGLPVVGN